jgi:nucleoside-diphosphate-sugar epimerase
MSVIAVSGVDGALRRRIVDALETVVDRVVTFDPSNENERAEFSTVETVVHLAFVEDLNQTAFHAVLEQPSGNLKKVVLVSSAMVYGAWPNNAIPLSEDAPVRPNPETSFAVHQADAERKLMEWSD